MQQDGMRRKNTLNQGGGDLNYNTYEQVRRLGVTFENDYYDEEHLNLYGSIEFSKVLATD